MSREIAREREILDWVDFAYEFHEGLWFPHRVRRVFSIQPSQIRSEIARFLALLRPSRPRRILELGTAAGGSLFLLARVAAPDAILITIDLPERDHRGGYLRWRESLYRSFAGPSQELHLIRADSHSQACLDRVHAILGDERLDVLFIDADHSYDGVTRDFALFAHLVRPGGIVALHDIIPDYRTRYGKKTQSTTGEVYRFWGEVKDRFKSWEIVEDPEQDGYGIGILTMADEGLPRRA